MLFSSLLVAYHIPRLIPEKSRFYTCFAPHCCRIVASDECGKMIAAIDTIREKHQKLYFSLPDENEVFRELPFMQQFSGSEQDSFKKRTKMEFFKQGDTLYSRGADGGNFWVVRRLCVLAIEFSFFSLRAAVFLT